VRPSRINRHVDGARDHARAGGRSQRPKILPNRWQENWSALADPRIKRERFDNLKFIPLSNDDPGTYLSLGQSG
jgi:hypothetical protein